MENFPSWVPFNSGGTCGPSIRTDITMISMPMRASPDARDSLWMSRYSDKGYETQVVHSAIMNCRLANILRTGIVGNVGNIERMTEGSVSPMMMPKAHIPRGDALA